MVLFQKLSLKQWVLGQLWDLTRQFRVNLKFEKLEGFGAQVRSGYDQRCSRERAPEARGGKKGEGSAAVGKWQNLRRERGPKNVGFWTAVEDQWLGVAFWCGTQRGQGLNRRECMRERGVAELSRFSMCMK